MQRLSGAAAGSGRAPRLEPRATAAGPFGGREASPERHASPAPGSGTEQRLPKTNRAPRRQVQAIVRHTTWGRLPLGLLMSPRRLRRGTVIRLRPCFPVSSRPTKPGVVEGKAARGKSATPCVTWCAPISRCLVKLFSVVVRGLLVSARKDYLRNQASSVFGQPQTQDDRPKGHRQLWG